MAVNDPFHHSQADTRSRVLVKSDEEPKDAFRLRRVEPAALVADRKDPTPLELFGGNLDS